MLIIFRRTIMPDATIRIITDGIVEGDYHVIGTLTFPNSKTWGKFWGAIQRGALNISELEVKLENLPYEEVTKEVTNEVE